MAEQTATVTVDLPGGVYDALIGSGLLVDLGRFIAERLGPRRAMLVFDEGLPGEYVVEASRSLAHFGFQVSSAPVRADEAHKTLETAHRVLVATAESRHERGDPVVALGGGVTGDVAGFVAAVYRRGVPLVQVPTTLLSMVDASVGGKTGVNLLTDEGLLKNMVGAFHQPSLVVADVQTLRTLPDRAMRAGLAECVKHGLISAQFDDPELLRETVEMSEGAMARDADALRALVSRHVALKARVVSQDERETTGARALLNLGHTFAHAIEPLGHLSPDGKASSAPLLHGEAVALGLVAAASAGAAIGATTEETWRAVRGAVERLGLPTRVKDLPHDDALMRAVLHDKKTAGGKARIIVPTEPGRAKVVEDPPARALREGFGAIRDVAAL